MKAGKKADKKADKKAGMKAGKKAVSKHFAISYYADCKSASPLCPRRKSSPPCKHRQMPMSFFAGWT